MPFLGCDKLKTKNNKLKIKKSRIVFLLSLGLRDLRDVKKNYRCVLFVIEEVFFFIIGCRNLKFSLLMQNIVA